MQQDGEFFVVVAAAAAPADAAVAAERSMNMPAITASPPPGLCGNLKSLVGRPQCSTIRIVPPKRMFLSSWATFFLLVALLPLSVAALGSGGEKAFFLPRPK